MDQIMRSIIILALVALVSYSYGRYMQPPKVKQVEVVKHDVRVVERIITHKDGSTEVERTTEDHLDTKKQTEINSNKPNWHASVLAGFSPKVTMEPIYGASIDHRFIGPTYLGVWGKTDHSFGLSVGLEF